MTSNSDQRMLDKDELRDWQDQALDALDQIMAFIEEHDTDLEFTTVTPPIARHELLKPVPPAPPGTIDLGHVGPDETVDDLLTRARVALDEQP